MRKFRLFFLISLLAGFSFTFSACSDDDDDDSNGDIVGSWVIDENASSVKVFLNGTDLSEVDQDYSSDDDYLLDKTITFNADGTFSSADSKGTYSLSGKKLTITVKTNEGEEMTIKEGASDNAMAEEFTGAEMEGMEFKSANFDKVEAVINGDKMSINVTMTTTFKVPGLDFGDMDLSGMDLDGMDLGGMESLLKGGEMTEKVEMIQVYNRK